MSVKFCATVRLTAIFCENVFCENVPVPWILKLKVPGELLDAATENGAPESEGVALVGLQVVGGTVLPGTLLGTQLMATELE